MSNRTLALDVSEEYTAIARRHWQAAGVADRIELIIAPAAARPAGTTLPSSTPTRSAISVTTNSS